MGGIKYSKLSIKFTSSPGSARSTAGRTAAGALLAAGSGFTASADNTVPARSSKNKKDKISQEKKEE